MTRLMKRAWRKLHLGRWLTTCLVLAVGFGSTDCVTEVCSEDSAAFELTITFESIPWTQADKLMIISEVELPDGRFDRRVHLMDMPEVTGNSLQLIMDPGGWSRDGERVASLAYKLTLRVLTADLVLVGQGRLEETLQPGSCKGYSMVVSGSSVECLVEGEPCLGEPDGSGGGHHVCARNGAAVECGLSTCGDGVLDRLAGELCDSGITGQPCNDVDDLCMPKPQVVDLALSPNPQYRRLLAATCPHNYTHRILGTFDRDQVDRMREPGWKAILSASLAVGDFHGTSPEEVTGTSTSGPHASGQEVALGAPTGWWNPAGGDGCELGTSDQTENRRGKVMVGDLPLTGGQVLSSDTLEPPLVGDNESLYGYALARGDLNGDGYDDLAISAPRGYLNAGYVVVAHGREVLTEDSGVAVLPDDDRLARIRDGAADEEGRFGHSLAVGDLNGDGYADLIVGSPGADNNNLNRAGAVDVIAGGPDRFAAGDDYEVGSVTENPVAARLLGNHANCRLGKSVAVGDVDGDGYGDLVVGATGATHDTQERIFIGAVHLVFGGPDLLGEDPAAPQATGPAVHVECDVLCAQSPVAGLSIRAPLDATPVDAQHRFGARLAVGDLDGDGLAEVVVSRPLLDAQGRGVVYVYRGSTLAEHRGAGPSWADVDSPPDLTIYGPPNTAGTADASAPQATGFGHRLLIADLNGDWQPDLVIAAPLTWVGPDGAVPSRPAAGAAYVIMGSRRSSWTGELDLADYADGAITEADAAYGVVTLYGPVIGAQMGIALGAGFRVLGLDTEPNSGLLLAVANHEEKPLEGAGGVMAVNLDGVFSRSSGNGFLELGEQCDCDGSGGCSGAEMIEAPGGGLTCLSFGYVLDSSPIPDCTVDSLIDLSPCDPADATPTGYPCGSEAEGGSRAVEVIQQCNENLRPPESTPANRSWGLTCYDLGFGDGDPLECNEATITTDGSCMVDLSSCIP